MLESHIYRSSFHIYVQITIYMSKLQYIYPDCNIRIQMVIYMSKMSILIYSACYITTRMFLMDPKCQ